MKIFNQTLIEKYLSEQMTPQEEQEFILKVKKDKVYRKKVATFVLFIKALQNVARDRERQVMAEVQGKLTWKKYYMIYGIYSNYYYTNNMVRYNSIYPQGLNIKGKYHSA